MADGDIHTVPHRGGWANRVEGKLRISSTHKTKIAAQKRGREMAILRRVEHLIAQPERIDQRAQQLRARSGLALWLKGRI